MNKLNALLATTALTGVAGAMVGAPAAFADSSGNFNATVAETQCVLSTDNISPGGLSGGIAGTLLTTTIQTPNGQGVALDIRPSLVTGLFTNTNITKSNQSQNATAAVKVFVKLDGHPVPPDTGGGITYDERFQQLSSNVFNELLNTSVCSFGFFGFPLASCSIDLILSTLAAHNFDFVAIAPGNSISPHTVEVDWAMVCATNGGSLAASNCSTSFTSTSAAACVGPGVITVTQVKNFQNDGTISIGP